MMLDVGDLCDVLMMLIHVMCEWWGFIYRNAEDALLLNADGSYVVK